MASYWGTYKLTVFFLLLLFCYERWAALPLEKHNEKLSCGDSPSSFWSCEFSPTLAEREQETHCQIGRVSGKYILEAEVKSWWPFHRHGQCTDDIFTLLRILIILAPTLPL